MKYLIGMADFPTGEFCRTFVKESKSNRSLYMVNPKASSRKLTSQKGSESNPGIKVASKNKFDKKRQTLMDTERTQTIERDGYTEKAKVKHNIRKKQLKQSNKPKTAKLSSNFGQDGMSSMTHRKTLSLYKV